jgi:hypothetical protein
MLVAITGVVQDPSTYSIVGTTLTFSAAPPTGTGNISVRYLGIPASGVATTAYRTVTEFTATAGQTTFSVPSYTVGYIDVYRNGVMLGSADYTATNGTTVVLAAGTTAGDLVETISFFVSSVLNAIPATPGSVVSSYIANDAVGSAQIAAGAVGTSEIANGITVNFADGSASTPSITNDGDANTGMFFPASDTIAFAEGGVEQMRLTDTGLLQFNSGYGSVATAYGCRAWVNFNGTGTVAIRGSGNVSSITDGGTGTYTVNFTTAMPDTNYAAIATSEGDPAFTAQVSIMFFNRTTNAKVSATTSAFTFSNVRASDSTPIDNAVLSVSVFR